MIFPLWDRNDALNPPRPLPKLIYITNRKTLPESRGLLDVIEQNLAAGIRGLYLREKDLAQAPYLDLAQTVNTACKKFQAQLILPAFIGFSDQFPHAALQATKGSESLGSLRTRFGANRLMGYSAHGLDEAQQAEAEGADYLFFAPIFTTTCKPGQKPIGLKALGQVCKSVQIPVYALGGIDQGNFEKVLQEGAFGIAAISLFQKEKDLKKLSNLIAKAGDD